MSKIFNQGRRDGQKGDFIGDVLHATFKGVTGGMFGSKVQKQYDDGRKQGQKDRNQNNRQGGKKRW